MPEVSVVPDLEVPEHRVGQLDAGVFQRLQLKPATGRPRGSPVALVGGGHCGALASGVPLAAIAGVAPNPWTLSLGKRYRSSVPERVTSFACPRLPSSREGTEVCR